MALAHSKVTSQGQISIPALLRQKLGIGPGSILEWDEDHGQIVVRRAGRFTSSEIRGALFKDQPPEPKSLGQLKEGVRRHIRRSFKKLDARD